MSEKLGDLTSEGINRAFSDFMQACNVSELRMAIENNHLLKSPIFHSLLQSEYTNQKSNTDNPNGAQKSFQARYNDFFTVLHFDYYHTLVSNARQEPTGQPGKPRAERFIDAFQTQSSQIGLCLQMVCFLCEIGVLDGPEENTSSVSLPIALTEPSLPSFLLWVQEVLPSTANHTHDQFQQTLNYLPINTDSRSSAIEWRCLNCGTFFADIHNNFVNMYKETYSRELALNGCFNMHRCPACFDHKVYPTRLLATETPKLNDLLLAASCLILPDPSFAVYLPPPLTNRDPDYDKVLEIRSMLMQEHFGHSWMEIDCRKDVRLFSYLYVYSPDELALTLRKIYQIEADGNSEKSKQRMHTDNLIRGMIHKVKSKEMALDNALETVRKIVGMNPAIFSPLFHIYPDAGGDAYAAQIAAAISEIIVEAHPEASIGMKIMAGQEAVEDHLRVGDIGLALSSMERLKKNWQIAMKDCSLDNTILSRLKIFILHSEISLLLLQRQPIIAVEKCNLAIEHSEQNITHHEEQGKLWVEDKQNLLGTLNRLGGIYLEMENHWNALTIFRRVIDESKELIQFLESSACPNFDKNPIDYKNLLINQVKYTLSGAISNLGKILSKFAATSKSLVAALTPHVEITRSLGSENLDQIFENIKSVNPHSLESDYILFLKEIFPDSNASILINPKISDDLIDQSVQHYRDALRISEEIEGYNFASIQARNLAIQMLNNDPQEAISLLYKSVQYARMVPGARNILETSLIVLSDVLKKSGNLGDASLVLEEAIRSKLKGRVKAGTKDFRKMFGEGLEEMAAELAEMRLKLGQKCSAIEALESTKSNLLAITMERVVPRVHEFAEDEDAKELGQMELQREELLSEIDILTAKVAMSTDKEASIVEVKIHHLKSEANELQQGIARLNERLLVKHPYFEFWVRHPTMNDFSIRGLEEILEKTSKSFPILGFFVSNNTLWSYLISGQEVEIHSLELGESRIRQITDEIQDILHAVPSGLTPAHNLLLKNLSAILLEPFEESLKMMPIGSPLVICPHKMLYMVPWPMLPSWRGTLVDAFSLYQIYGLDILGILIQKPRVEQKAIIIIADPLEGTDMALPGALEEADAINEVVSTTGQGVNVLRGREANLFNLVQTLSDHSILHFACHGSFNGTIEGTSELYLAPAKERGFYDSGHLSADKIVEYLKLRDTELVNLSACDTGLLRPDGEGEVSGLTQAFICAGAKTVMANLWSLIDDKACLFNRVFYENYLLGNDLGTALRTTQLACISGELGPEMVNPQNWAGYVLVGSPR